MTSMIPIGPSRPYDIGELRSKDVVIAMVGNDYLIAKGVALLERIRATRQALPADLVRVQCKCWDEAEALRIVLNEKPN